MPSEVVEKRIVPGNAQEVVTLCDDFGTPFLVQIPVTSTTEQRAQMIAAAKATLDANEAQLINYAAATGHDLTAHRNAGITARTELQKKNRIAAGTVL